VCRIDAEDSATKYLRVDDVVSSGVRVSRWENRKVSMAIGVDQLLWRGDLAQSSLKKMPLGKERCRDSSCRHTRFSSGGVTVHLNSRRPLVTDKGLIEIGELSGYSTAGSQASLEVGDKGKPGESRGRKATRLQRSPRRQASRAAESHYRGGRI
jgi:hypothetical protein